MIKLGFQPSRRDRNGSVTANLTSVATSVTTAASATKKAASKAANGIETSLASQVQNSTDHTLETLDHATTDTLRRFIDSKIMTMSLQGVPSALVGGFAVTILFDSSCDKCYPEPLVDVCVAGLSFVVIAQFYSILALIGISYRVLTIASGGQAYPVWTAEQERAACLRAVRFFKLVRTPRKLAYWTFDAGILVFVSVVMLFAASTSKTTGAVISALIMFGGVVGIFVSLKQQKLANSFVKENDDPSDYYVRKGEVV